jgi:hypothetical protein
MTPGSVTAVTDPLPVSTQDRCNGLLMKKIIAGAILLVVALSWAPLTVAMAAAGAHHRCCHRMHSQVAQPAMCGAGRCCVSSDRTTTLPAVSPTPLPDSPASSYVQAVLIKATTERITPCLASAFRSCFDLSMIFRI